MALAEATPAPPVRTAHERRSTTTTALSGGFCAVWGRRDRLLGGGRSLDAYRRAAHARGSPSSARRKASACPRRGSVGRNSQHALGKSRRAGGGFPGG